MMKIMTITVGMALLCGCSPSNTPAAAGTHNLSKGQCTDIRACGEDCDKVKKEALTQTHCEMLGGTFTPRKHKKGFWF